MKMTDIDVTRPLKTKSGIPVTYLRERVDCLLFRAEGRGKGIDIGDQLSFYRDGRYLRSREHEYDLIYADDDMESSDMKLCGNAVRFAIDICNRLGADFHAIVGDMT